MSDTERVLDALSLARTALDDPSGLPEDEADGGLVNNPGGLKEYAIDRIDDAMRWLDADENEVKFSLMVAHNGAFVSRHFDAEDEAIDAIGEAISRKMTFPDDVVTLVVGRVGP